MSDETPAPEDVVLETHEAVARIGVSRKVIDRFVKAGAVQPTEFERKSGGRRKWAGREFLRLARLAQVWKRLAPLLPGRGRRCGIPWLVPPGAPPVATRIALALPRCPAGGVILLSADGVHASAGKEPVRDLLRKANGGPIVVVSAP